MEHFSNMRSFVMDNGEGNGGELLSSLSFELQSRRGAIRVRTNSCYATDTHTYSFPLSLAVLEIAQGRENGSTLIHRLMEQKWSLGCVNSHSHPAARASQEAGFTQPRDRSFVRLASRT